MSITLTQAQQQALAAAAAKQNSILLACQDQIQAASEAGLYNVVVPYDLSGDAGYQLGLSGFALTNLGTTPITYSVDWSGPTPPPSPPVPGPTYVIPVANGGTGFGVYTPGDMLFADSSTSLAKLGVGLSNYVLMSIAGVPQYGQIVNASVSASAAIAYTKLALTGSILNADLAGGITQDKLSGSIPYSKLVLTGSIVDGDIVSVATTKLTGTVTNAQLAGSIAATKLVGTDIATVGTITSGAWTASVISPAFGGTGVANNAAATLTRSGNHALTLTTSGTTTLTLPTSGTVATVVPASSVVCDSPPVAGHGSTNTAIRRWTNATTTGSDITYADSATLGGTFTINTAGKYAVMYVDYATGGTCTFGVSVNSSQLTTSIGTITTANRLGLTVGPGANFQAVFSCVFTAAASDVVRCHTAANPNATDARAQFRIERVA